VQLDKGYQRGTRAATGSGETLFSVSSGGSSALCSLSFSISGSVLDFAGVQCSLCNGQNVQTTTSSPTITYSWSFLETVGGDIFNIEATIIFDPKNNNVQYLQMCFTSACGITSTCMTYPSTGTSASSGMSFASSDPEGFVLAFLHASSSSFIPPPSTSSQSNPSSKPEGFVFAFTEPSASSNPSIESSKPEGFVFAFVQQSSAA